LQKYFSDFLIILSGCALRHGDPRPSGAGLCELRTETV
jgi:hypothetical protein